MLKEIECCKAIVVKVYKIDQNTNTKYTKFKYKNGTLKNKYINLSEKNKN